MSDTASTSSPVGRAVATIPVRPVVNNDMRIDNGHLLHTGTRHVPGEAVTLYVSEDSTLTASLAHELCGYLLYLDLEQTLGHEVAAAYQTQAVPLIEPEEYTVERSVWPVVTGVDVVHLAPFLGWIAASEPIVLREHASRWGLIEALAALANALDHDHHLAHTAITAARATAGDTPPTERPTMPTFGSGVHVIWSDHNPDAVSAVTEEERSEALDAAQIISESETWNPAAQAIAWPEDASFWSYRLTLWDGLSHGRWLLLRETNPFFTAQTTVIVCDNPRTAALAFERERAYQVQSGRSLIVTHTPWSVWHAAQAIHSNETGSSAQ